MADTATTANTDAAVALGVEKAGSLFDMDGFTKNAKIVENTDLNDGTSYAVVGEGHFDKLMEVTRKHIDALLLSNCIRKEDYATMYADMYKTNLQIVLLAEEKGWDNAVKKRQIQGINESFKKDMLKIMIDGWTVGFSASEEAFFLDGDSEKAIPYPLTYDAITDLYKDFISGEFDAPISYTKEESQTPVL